MWGFQRTPNEAHNHDDECYENIATTEPRRDTFLPDDVAEYAEESYVDYPEAELLLRVADHDDGSDDDIYDLGKESGQQGMSGVLFTLWHVSNLNWEDFILTGHEYYDGDNDDSARLEFELQTPADSCAVDAATQARQGNLPNGIVYECDERWT